MRQQLTVSKAQFKPQALHYLRLVERSKRPLIITHKKRPVIKVVAYGDDLETVKKSLKGSVTRYDDPLEPVAVGDWGELA